MIFFFVVHFRFLTCDKVLSLRLTTFFTFSSVFYKQRKNYITVFWNGDSYYPARILPVQS